MAKTGKIRADFDTLRNNYPTYRTLPPPLQKFMDDLGPGNTPCCVQVSHALNKAGRSIPPNSFRRANSKIGAYYYILAVDELEQFLSGLHGRGEEIKRDSSGKMRSTAEMKRYLDGMQGILLFRSAGAGHHTELWDETHIMQDGKAVSGQGAIMNESNIFGQPRVLFWEVSLEDANSIPVPDWLQGWWNVYDGNTYYYYFSDEHVATYTKTAPKNITNPPVKVPLNEGDVTISQDLKNIITVVTDWNPADGGATKETFTRLPANSDSMNGVSNRYAPLLATKMK
jgi:hypothetical protein